MKTVINIFVCVALMTMASVASALTVDLASPQEGTTLAPEGTLELAITLTNDSEAADFVVLVLDVAVGAGTSGDGIPEPAPGNIPGISHKPIRIKIAPGESIVRNLELVLPTYKQLPAGEYAVTISVEATGLLSKTQASDTVSFLLVKP